jgi:acyl-CoA thioesterase FadM
VTIEDDRFHLEHRVVSKRLAAIAAEGTGTIVTYHHSEGRKAALPEELRRRIEALEATALEA